MKSYIKIFSLILAISLLVITTASCGKEANTSNNPFYVEDISEDEENHTYCLTSFYGSGSDILIPSGINIIGAAVFKDNEDITSITVNDPTKNDLKIIEANAFENCINLTTVVLPQEMEEIKSFAFFGCENLTEIQIPSGIQVVDEYTFADCKMLNKAELPDSITQISVGAFSGCTSLCNINIPKNVNYIAESAFSGCSALTEIYIPQSVKKIDGTAFIGCDSLMNVTYGGTKEEWINASNGNDTGLEEKCVIHCLDQDVTVEYFPGTALSEVKKLKEDVPYIKRYTKVLEIPQKWLLENCDGFRARKGFTLINTGAFDIIPVVKSGDEIIIRTTNSSKIPDTIQFQYAEIDKSKYYSGRDLYLNPNTKKFTLAGTSHIIDNVNGVTDHNSFPTESVHRDAHYSFTNANEPSTCTVGYFNGTSYKEETIEINKCKVKFLDGDSYEPQKTKEGYFYVTVPNLSPGIYRLSCFRQFDWDGVERGYFVKIE